MIELNALGFSLNSDKRFFDAQSKKILSFKSIQACILQQCLEEFKHLSLDQIIDLMQPSSLHPQKIPAFRMRLSDMIFCTLSNIRLTIIERF